MPFVGRHQVDEKVRKKFERQTKARLRRALLDPTLTPEQREAIKQQIAQVSRPKVYAKDAPPPVGAISFDD